MVKNRGTIDYASITAVHVEYTSGREELIKTTTKYSTPKKKALLADLDSMQDNGVVSRYDVKMKEKVK